MNARSVPPLPPGLRESRSDRHGAAGKRHAAAAVADHDPQIGRTGVGVVHTSPANVSASASPRPVRPSTGAPADAEPRHPDRLAVVDQRRRRGVEHRERLGAAGGPRRAQRHGSARRQRRQAGAVRGGAQELVRDRVIGLELGRLAAPGEDPRPVVIPPPARSWSAWVAWPVADSRGSNRAPGAGRVASLAAARAGSVLPHRRERLGRLVRRRLRALQ